ncbi:homeotic protein caudal [Hyalella azteca]|uniref:Homeotic protein caudal n=1 Tax=Hyalella azteca TaxID=294128 RepID=A0A8B7P1Z4_HYAAZ|nr:homeotic protein caudal [Hyalella azteca]
MFETERDESKVRHELNMYQSTAAQYFDPTYQAHAMHRHAYSSYYSPGDQYFSSIPNLPRSENSPPLSVTSQTPSTSSPATSAHTSSPVVLGHRALPTPPHLSPDTSPAMPATSRSRSEHPGHFGYPGQGINSATLPASGHEFMANSVAASLYPTNHHHHHPGIYGLGPRDGLPNLPSSVQQQGLDVQRTPVRQDYHWMKKEPSSAVSSSSRSRGGEGRTRTRDKYRVVYSEHQRLELEKEYNFNRYITIKRKTELAETLSLSERQIKIWFQNRRAKDRKNTNKKKASPSSKEMPCGGQMTSGAAPPNQHSILGTRLAQGSALPQAPGNTIDPPSGYLIPETSTRMLPSEEFQSQMGLMDGQQNTAPHEHMSPEALQLVHLHQHQQQHQQFSGQHQSPNGYPIPPPEYSSPSFMHGQPPFLPPGSIFHPDDFRFNQMNNFSYFDAIHNHHQAAQMYQQQQMHLHHPHQQQLHHQQHQQHHQQQTEIASVGGIHALSLSEDSLNSAMIPTSVTSLEHPKTEMSPTVKAENSP